MKCPHCQDEIVLHSDAAYINFKLRQEPTKALTLCCGKGVEVSGTISYKWNHTKTTLNKLSDGTFWDDWGHKAELGNEKKAHYWVCDGMAFDDEVSAKYHQTNTEGNPRIVFVEEKFNE